MPCDAEASAPSPIHETENALIVRVPVSRRRKTPNNQPLVRLFSFITWLIVPTILIGIGIAGKEIKPAWIVLGILAALYILARFLLYELYFVLGKEILEVDIDRILVRYDPWPYQKTLLFETSRIRHICYSETVYTKFIILPNKGGSGGILVDPNTYAIICDYDGETISLLGWLDKPLAKEILQRIKIRFPSYRV